MLIIFKQNKFTDDLVNICCFNLQDTNIFWFKQEESAKAMEISKYGLASFTINVGYAHAWSFIWRYKLTNWWNKSCIYMWYAFIFGYRCQTM